MIFGRKETFALEVQPLAGPPPEGDPSAASTWTAARMYVAGRNVFRNVSRDSRLVSDEVNWPAIGLARWLVRAWPKLFHGGAWAGPALSRNARDFASLMNQALIDDFDAPDSMVDARDVFVRTHSLRAAASGAAFPDVWFARDGGLMSIAWNDSMDGEIFFTLSKGEVDVPDVDFAAAARGYVQWVSELLAEAGPDITVDHDKETLRSWLDRFESRDAAIEAILEETRMTDDRWRGVAAAAGLETDDPAVVLALPESQLKKGTLAGAGASSIALAFRCASPQLPVSELAGIRKAIVEAPRNEEGFTALRALAKAVDRPASGTYDFVRGYQLARSLRQVLSNEADYLDIEGMIAGLGVPILNLPLSDPDLDGGCVCDDTHGPVIFVNPNSRRGSVPWGRRVVLAHELCHLLFDREVAVNLGVISGPWAPPRIERTANAFAIELLLPLAGIEQTVGRLWDDPTDAGVEKLMNKYELGITAVTEHVRNLRNPRNR